MRNIKPLFSLVALLVLTAPAMAQSVPTPPQAAIDAGCTKLVVNENFTQWTTQPGGYSWRGDSGLWYNSQPFFTVKPYDPGIVWNGPGRLQLSAAAVSTMYRSGLPAAYSGSFPGTRFYKYGYFEASFRLVGPVTSAAGNNWNSFWLFSKHHQEAYHDPDEWSEIDFIETNVLSYFLGVVHDWHSVGATNTESPAQSPPFPWPLFPGAASASQYDPAMAQLNLPHTYGGLWQKGYTSYYYDNVKMNGGPTNAINDTDPMTVVLSSNGNGVSKSEWQWVHVWECTGGQ